MKQCSHARITQREKEAQELQQAILCLTASAKPFSYPPVFAVTAPHCESCRPSELGSVSGGGERRTLHPAHTVDRAEALRGEGAGQSPGKDGHRSGGAPAGEDPEGDR